MRLARPMNYRKPFAMTETLRRKSRDSFVMPALLVSVLLCSFGPLHAQDAAPNAYTDLSQYVVSGNQVVPRQALSNATPANG